MRVIHASHEEQDEFNTGTSDWLEVRRGHTSFPQRPLTSSRCLIGSGTNCHLQLGGDVPMLHSLLVLDEGRWTLDVIAPEPTLFVNGEACRHHEMCIGDRIQLADFEFALCRGAGGPPRTKPRTPHHPTIATASLRGEATSLSASGVLERMEQEIVAIDGFERGRVSGAKALLDAIRSQPVILKLNDAAKQSNRKAA